MHNDIFRAFDCFKGFLNDMLPCLGQHLNGHIIGNQVLLDQFAKECIFCLRSRGKSYLNLFKSDLYKELEEFHLLLQIHGDHQRLVSVS